MIDPNDIQTVYDLLRKLRLPCHSLKVFGRARLNVHVICKSRNSADKWALALSQIEPSRKISCTKTLIERVAFKADAQNQNAMPGWLVTL